MAAVPPVGMDTFSAAAALRTATAVPVLLDPGLIYVFRVVSTPGEPWELISQIQTTLPGRVVVGVSCLVFFQGHPSKYYETFSVLLNFKWKPGLQPPHHLSSALELHFLRPRWLWGGEWVCRVVFGEKQITKHLISWMQIDIAKKIQSIEFQLFIRYCPRVMLQNDTSGSESDYLEISFFCGVNMSMSARNRIFFFKRNNGA